VQFHLISPLDRFFGGTGGTGGTAQDLVRAGGTGGTGIAWAHAGRTDRQSFMVVPPVPRISPTKLCRTGWSTTSTTGPTRVHDCPVSLTKSDFIE
jgi:hypothetical protein